MKFFLFILLLAIFSCHGLFLDAADNRIQQIHLSLGENPKEIVVTWSTFQKPYGSEVFVWPVGNVSQTKKVEASSKIFTDGGPLKLTQYISTAVVKDLQENVPYSYSIYYPYGRSQVYNFTVPRSDSQWSPSVAIFGDMGLENAQSLQYLKKETDEGKYDAMIHVGDFAYDMDSNNGEIGDAFMRLIENVAANVPYMVCPGNHEEAYNFSNYRNRFTMPGSTDSLYYSFDLGPVHFISISTEFYYFLNYGIKSLVLQYQWLVDDLKKAVANRAERPWIIVYGHRPMYCSNHNEADCNNYNTITRIGLPLTHFFGLEDLFYDHGVDVQIWAHEHSYERFWPLYDYKVYNGSIDEPYRNPRAPIHIITGSAGCSEGRTPFNGTSPAWSAFHSNDYGYTRLKAHNKTHLHIEQVSVDKKGEVIDSFWIIKDTHEAFQRE